MKSKIIILILVILLITVVKSFSQSVPNTSTFKQSDVETVIGGSYKKLSELFTNSNDAYFDATYKGSKDRLSNFRNYTIPSATPPSISVYVNHALRTCSTHEAQGVSLADNGSAITAKGAVWNTTGTAGGNPPDISEATKTNDGTGTADFTSYLTGLTPLTTYYVRMYATNAGGTSYSGEFDFTTLTGLPSIISVSATGSSVTITSFVASADVSNIGCSAITERGMVAVLGSGTPTTSDIKVVTTPNATGSQSATFTGLTPNKLYTYKGYAINSYGTSYSAASGTATTLATETITASKSWVCPTGVSSINVQAWGGGGAGGGATGTASRGGGGAGGSYSIGTATVVAGNSYTVTIGAGGVASATVTRPGANTSFTTLVVANGGAGAVTTSGTNGNGATAVTTNSVGTTIYVGGNGGNGVAAGTSGGGGGGAGSTGAGNAATLGTAGTAKANNGGAGGNGVTTANTRNNGGTYGGGGSGGLSSSTTDRTGGNGSIGLMIITYP